VTVYTSALLGSRLKERFELIHLDTSDHRDMTNLSRLDVANIVIACKSILGLGWLLVVRRPAIVYLPISVAPLPYFRDGLLILLAKWFSAAKIVAHLHTGYYFLDTFYSGAPAWFRRFIRATLSNVDLGVVLGFSFKHVFGGLVKRVRVIPNGSIFDPGPPSRVLEEPSGMVQIGYLGALRRAKGLFDLLASAKRVTELHPEVLFRIAGPWWDQEPETEPAARDFVEQHSLRGHLEFIGEIEGDSKKDFFAAIDVFVFPSHNEGLPLVILEAMAASRPVVSTKGVGAIAEVVQDGETGILVNKEDPDGIASAILRLVEHPELRDAMGRASRRKFEEQYTFDIHVQTMAEMFTEVVTSGRD
jgi:glycosyltransferase involved in cell wall biosynthesis